MQTMGKHLLFFFVGVCLMACSPWTDHVTLINRANKDVKSVSVAIGKSAVEVGPLKPDQRVALTFTNAGEGGYHVKVSFADGQKLDGEVGYVTANLNSTDTIELRADKIQLN